MTDQDKTSLPAPATPPEPAVGGSYIRNADGTLTPVEGPCTLPENQPQKPTQPAPDQE